MSHTEPTPSDTNLLQQPDVSHLASREAWQTEIALRRDIGEVALSNIQVPLGINGLDDRSRAYDALMCAIDFVNNDQIASIVQHIDALGAAALEGQPSTLDYFSRAAILNDAKPIVMADPKVNEFIESRDLNTAHQGLVEAMPKFIEGFVIGVKRGVELGYIPVEVEGRLETALSKTSVRVVDSAVLDTHGSLSAYYRTEEDEIGINHDVQNSGEGHHDNLVHEFTHKVSGGTFKSPEAGSTEYQRPRVGYSTEIRPEEYSRTGLNEAVTHHLTLGILNGDFETFDPDERTDGDKIYFNYRKIVAEFINRSNGLIDVKTVTNGFYEDTQPGRGDTIARRKFVKEVLKTYGPGALTKLDKLCNLSDLIGKEKLAEVIISRIHPPEVDEQGNVIAIGRIDTENLPDFNDLFKTPQGNVV